MAGPTQPERPVDSSGLFGHFSALIAAKLGYLRARLKLAGIEGKEAGIHLGIILGLAIVSLVGLVFGYFLLVIGLAFLVALAFGGGNAWIGVLLGAAALHVIGALVLVIIAKTMLGKPLFPLTLDEFKKDQEWLTKTTNPH